MCRTSAPPKCCKRVLLLNLFVEELSSFCWFLMLFHFGNAMERVSNLKNVVAWCKVFWKPSAFGTYTMLEWESFLCINWWSLFESHYPPRAAYNRESPSTIRMALLFTWLDIYTCWGFVMYNTFFLVVFWILLTSQTQNEGNERRNLSSEMST